MDSQKDSSWAKRLFAKAAKEIVRERKRFERIGDLESLHDFRVALRRARTYVDAYRHFLDDKRSLNSFRVHVKKCLRVTAKARDAEAACLRLEELLAKLAADKRKEFAALHSVLETKKVELAGRSLKKLPGRRGGSPESMRRLRAQKKNFDDLTIEVVVAEIKNLKRRLKKIDSPLDQEAAHPARIAAKRARYLLELLSDHSSPGARHVATLKELQDGLGELRDLHLLRELIANLWEREFRSTAGVQRRIMQSIAQREVQVSTKMKRYWLKGRWSDRLHALDMMLRRRQASA